MISREQIAAQMKYNLLKVDSPELIAKGARKYEGKVRECFILGERRILIATDRLSAFDRVLSSIPFKGQVLNSLASYWFKQTADIVANHVIEEPHPNVLIAREVEMLPVEVVVRGYLAGSAWRDYEKGRDISGIMLAPGFKKSGKLAQPIITPSTKAEKGLHDEPISTEQIIRSGLVEEGLWKEVSAVALKLFARGTELAERRGLILVDTKYEFGLARTSSGARELVIADEIHTADSSRYWLASTYQERFSRGEDPEMLDKEFVRRWLMERGYMGEGEPPVMDDAFRVEVAERYMKLYELISGQEFTAKVGNLEEEIREVLANL